jgi:hypothetical protein
VRARLDRVATGAAERGQSLPRFGLRRRRAGIRRRWSADGENYQEGPGLRVEREEGSEKQLYAFQSRNRILIIYVFISEVTYSSSRKDRCAQFTRQ